jgi:cysteine-rich repeat protein
MSFLWVFFAQFSLLTVTLPRQRLRAGADLDNEGGEAEWAGNIISRCGNGRRDESETCDDGNLQDGDGCDRHCHLEIPRGCEKMFDRLSWQRWANHSQSFVKGANGTTTWEAPGSLLTFYGEKESSASPGQLVDWKHPQMVSCRQ